MTHDGAQLYTYHQRQQAPSVCACVCCLLSLHRFPLGEKKKDSFAVPADLKKEGVLSTLYDIPQDVFIYM